MGKKLTWLHISDIHFRPKLVWRDAPARVALLKFLKQGFAAEQFAKPDFIFCTGDVAFGEDKFGALQEQYADAESFFSQLLASCGNLAREHLFVVPGNHDVNRAAISYTSQRQLNIYAENPDRHYETINTAFTSLNDEAVKNLSRLKEYGEFRKRFLKHQGDDERHVHANVIVHHDLRIGVGCFNSAWSASGDEDDRNLWLAAESQFAQVQSVIDDCQLRIGLVHHPIDWLNRHEFEFAKKRIPSKFDIWLHGHSHDQWVDDAHGNVVIGAGAIGAKESDEFGINLTELDIESGQCCAKLYKYFHDGDEWGKHIIPLKAPDGVWPFKLAALMPKTAPSPPRHPGLLSKPADSRLQPREGRLYGRADDVAKVQRFLSGNDPTHPNVALVVGSAGEGKTEVCKAALKAWLTESPASAAYYIELPDRGSVADLVFRVGNAIGNPTVETLEKLQAQLLAGLYYLDNLEGIAELPDGKDALRTLAQTPGVRLLASSRVKLATVFGTPIEIDRLPDDAALRLFRELWSGADGLPDDAQLAPFVINKLGAHALSVTLVARLGNTYSFNDVRKRWDETGAALASDTQDDTRHGNLSVSLRLTAAALAAKHGTLALWTLVALFDEGLPDELLAQFEHDGGWPGARPLLVAHHVVKRREGRWHMLPPLARYALAASLIDADGFSWAGCRAPVLDYFLRMANQSGSNAIAPGQRSYRRELLSLFPAFVVAICQEHRSAEAQSSWLDTILACLADMYLFRVNLSYELLSKLAPTLSDPALPTLCLGDLQRVKGLLGEARDSYRVAMAHFKVKKNCIGQANALKGLGHVEFRSGQPRKARRLFNKSLGLFVIERHDVGRADALQSLGDLAFHVALDSNGLEEARDFYNEALVLFENMRSGLGQAYTLRSQGDLQSRLGNSEVA